MFVLLSCTWPNKLDRVVKRLQKFLSVHYSTLHALAYRISRDASVSGICQEVVRPSTVASHGDRKAAAGKAEEAYTDPEKVPRRAGCKEGMPGGTFRHAWLISNFQSPLSME